MRFATRIVTHLTYPLGPNSFPVCVRPATQQDLGRYMGEIPLQPGPMPEAAILYGKDSMPSYVRQHAQQAAFGSGSDGALPYARAASMEER